MLYRFSNCPPPLLALLLGLAATGLLVGCSSSRAPQSDSATETPTGPPYALLYETDRAELVLHDAHADTSLTLLDEARFAGTRAPSPDGRHLAFSYATSDSSHLALLDLERHTLQQVHAHAGEVTYSLAWHPEEGDLAFAFYVPAADGKRGPGDVRIATPDGSTRSVGCRAAREVLSWLPDGSMAVRDDDNLYVVAASDCATQASIDARRMHHLTYAPNGHHLAYIHRELNYDRSAGAYVPDSSLFVSDADGRNAEELFGDDRRIRHLRWSPDGTELAFDMRTDDADHRLIVIHDANRDRTVYLIPPETAPDADQMHPRWSSSGRHVAFTLRNDSGTAAAVRVDGQTRRLGPTAGPVWGWVDDQALAVHGPDSLRIKALDGETRYARPTPAMLIHVWTRPVS